MTSTRPKNMMGIMKAANAVHVALYRLSAGKFANRVANLPVLLLTTVGRKSGKETTTPVVYIQDGPDYLVSASAGGMDWHPGWYYNLKSTPKGKIQIGDKTVNIQAVITGGEERARLYDKFKAASSNFQKYEKGTTRVIPVIRLTPIQT